MLQEAIAKILNFLKDDLYWRQVFSDSLVSRKDFARLLEIDRTTIWRWEQEIISDIPPLKIDYFSESRPLRSNYLDAYQRFLSAIICILKGGEVQKGIKSNKQIKTFLKANFTYLKRTNFEQWIGE